MLISKTKELSERFQQMTQISLQKQRPVFVTVLREEMRINYPYEAMRELAMNLIMHRNYQTNSPARFYEYSDRIEMENPGNLYGKVQPENFPNVTDYRNPIIADAMKVFGYVNSFGRGISMVQEELEENKNGSAIFDFQYISTFKVTVMNADLDSVKAMESNTEKDTRTIQEQYGTVTEKVTDRVTEKVTDRVTENQQLILDNISRNPTVSSKELSVIVGITPEKIRENISKLKAKGLLERIGSDRGGYWKVKQ